MRIFAILIHLILGSYLKAEVPTIEARYETTPIPAGTESSDDIAIWLHPTHPEKSLIVGVSKNKVKDGGLPGIAIYNLKGKELKFIFHDRLNNVDLKYNFPFNGKDIDIAVASNRDKKALSIFKVSEQKIDLLADLPMLDQNGNTIPEEPYGFCLSKSKNNKFYAFSPMKSGLIYQHQLKEEKGKLISEYVKTIDSSSYLTKKMDQHLIDITIKEVLYEEDELSTAELAVELAEEIGDRFQLEGCVVDDENNTLYYGMENLGVWKFNLGDNHPVELIATVSKAKSEPNADIFPEGTPRLTNDIEGLAMHYGPDGKGALIVSVQGINEYAFFDRQNNKYIGSFRLNYGTADPITETDGLELLSASLSPEFPLGVFVVHDHHNTDDAGKILNGNYKITSNLDIFKFFPQLVYKNYIYDPRK
jgi:3-phytase